MLLSNRQEGEMNKEDEKSGGGGLWIYGRRNDGEPQWFGLEWSK